jgi:hypothetical protein
MDGFPAGSQLPWLVQKTAGVLVMKVMLRTGRIMEGVKLPAKYLPPVGSDAREEASKLEAVIRRFESANGPLTSHPLFGGISREKWERYHCIHCAHHLSFVIPEPASA